MEKASIFNSTCFAALFVRDTAIGPLAHLAHYWPLPLFYVRKDAKEVIFEAKQEVRVGSAPNFLRIDTKITVRTV